MFILSNIYISLLIVFKCSVFKIPFIQKGLSADRKKVFSSNSFVSYQSDWSFLSFSVLGENDFSGEACFCRHSSGKWCFGGISLRLELCLEFLRTHSTPLLLQQPGQCRNSGRVVTNDPGLKSSCCSFKGPVDNNLTYNAIEFGSFNNIFFLLKRPIYPDFW